MKRLNKLGYTKLELLVIVFLLGIVAFITINQTSYAFAIDNTEAVNDVKRMIVIQAEDYALDHLELFNETKTTFISVNDLVEAGYMITDKDGLVTNPSEPEKNFNDSKIKLEYQEESSNVIATITD